MLCVTYVIKHYLFSELRLCNKIDLFCVVTFGGGKYTLCTDVFILKVLGFIFLCLLSHILRLFLFSIAYSNIFGFVSYILTFFIFLSHILVLFFFSIAYSCIVFIFYRIFLYCFSFL